MKKFLLITVCLFVLGGQAYGESKTENTAPEKWEGDFRHCHIRKWFSKNELDEIGYGRDEEGQSIVIEPEEIPDILKAIRVVKKCTAFLQCLEDREAGKVKHCYSNDRRWR